MMTINRGLFTSLRGDWKAPRALYQTLDAEVCFDCDPCPAKPKFDGLEESWGNINFVNPPYGKGLEKWVQKGSEESLKRKMVVFLLPSRTDTRWWHEYVMKATEIRFI